MTTASAVRLGAAAGLVGGVVVAVLARDESSLDDPDRWWAVVAVLTAATATGAALPVTARLLRPPGLVPVLILGAVAATYACVPETDHIGRVALLAALTVVVEVVLRRQVPVAVTLVVAMVVLWSGVHGATGRPSALVGAAFAAWGLVLLPLVAATRPGTGDRSTLVRSVVAGLGTVAALAVARTGGIADTGTEAAVAAVAGATLSYGAAVVAVAVSARRDATARPHPP